MTSCLESQSLSKLQILLTIRLDLYSELGKTNAQMDTERGKILQQAPLLDDCGRRRALDDTITSKGSGIGRQHSKHLILGLQHGRILDQCDTGKSDAAWDVTMDIEIAD